MAVIVVGESRDGIGEASSTLARLPAWMSASHRGAWSPAPPPEAGSTPQRREVGPTRCDPSRVKRWLDPGWNLPAVGENAKHWLCFLAARRSAINASTEAQLQVFSLVIAAPEPIRARFRGQKLAGMLNTAANLRVHSSWDVETASTLVALRSLARRAHAMLKEAREHQKAIVTIIRSWRPDLLEEFGVGPIVAATVLCAWSHPGRIHSEAAFAMLAGVAPIPANSGQVTTRHRLDRYGDRQLNRALHRGPDPNPVPASHPRLRRPSHRRREEQPRDQTLTRFVARDDLYRLLENGAAAA